MKYDLVFEGGGAKGIAFTGALAEFEARGHTFDRLMGTSAGAIMATFMAAGYNAAEMARALDERIEERPVFTEFMGIPLVFQPEIVQRSITRQWLRELDLPLIPALIEDALDDQIFDRLMESKLYRHIFSFVEQGGWFTADAFVVWLKAKLNEGVFRGAPRNFGDMTLAAFHKATGTHLSVVAADIDGQRLLVLNHRTAPECPVVWAVRMSMSVPLLWQEVIWHPDWGSYRGNNIDGNAIVDGGLLSNFPIELFVTNSPMWTAVMGEKETPHLIGLLIDEMETVPGLPADVASSKRQLAELRPVQRIMGMIDTATRARDKAVMDAYRDFVVRLPAKGFGTTEFDMSDERRAALVEAGSQAMKNFFDDHATKPMGVESLGDSAGDKMNADDIAERILGE